jgi:hypothetical protein
MPVGLSLGSKADAAGAAGDGTDEDSSASRSSGSPSTSGGPGPAYDREAFSDMLSATAASARRDSRNRTHARGAAPVPAAAGGRGAVQQPNPATQFGVQNVSPSMADAWGTTQESPENIARRIAESNLGDAEAGGPQEEDDGELVDAQISSSEAKYASLESMSADIKKLDEVFEVLASVPWLDEGGPARRTFLAPRCRVRA